jgi:hypothetical protein
VELLDVIEAAGANASGPLAKLHRIVEETVAFFADYPDFRRILRHARDADETVAAALTRLAPDRVDLFPRTLALMTGIVEEGQRVGEIREGSPDALIHLYMALVYEHVFLADSVNPAGALTLEQFQDLVDGALRAPRPEQA